jgi:hypothetical protein
MLSQNLPGGTKKKHENFSKDSHCPRQDCNRTRQLVYGWTILFGGRLQKERIQCNGLKDGQKIMTCTPRPVAGQRHCNKFPRKRVRRQQSDNFRCYATHYEYNSRGRGVFYMVRIYALLDNGCVFYGPT